VTGSADAYGAPPARTTTRGARSCPNAKRRDVATHILSVTPQNVASLGGQLDCRGCQRADLDGKASRAYRRAQTEVIARARYKRSDPPGSV
jgi:hypothetical protein